MTKRTQQQLDKLVRQTTTEVHSAQRAATRQRTQKQQQQRLQARGPEQKTTLSPAQQQAIAREMLRTW